MSYDMTYLCRTPRQHDTPVSCVAGGAQRHGQLSPNGRV